MQRSATAVSILVALMALTCLAPSARAWQALESPTKPETQWRITIPLQDGELQVGELIGELADEIGMDGEAIKKLSDYSVPVRTPLGSSTIRLISSITDGIVKLDINADEVAVTVDRVRLRQHRTDFNGAIQRLIENFFPEAADLARAQFGVMVHLPDGTTARLSAANAPKDAVVLIHGLDDAGHLWGQLIPGLLDAGHGVCEITYPDDQAIKDSSEFVASLFHEMHEDGVVRVSIVAHSMGCLISRDILTNMAYYAGSVDGGERFPPVDRLIMVGPPNHGSKMALFRIATEARDQTVRALSGDGLLIGGFFDGAGEAQDDLMPGSAFLTDLNSRSLPSGLPVTIIAGSASPITADGLAAMAKRLDDMGKSKYGQIFAGSDLEKSASDLVDGLGDGCVSLESTRLDGVTDYVVVEANHLSMIRNVSSRSDRVPQAVPIILARLAGEQPAKP